MGFFVTGIDGQLGHDVMNKQAKRGYEGIGLDIQLTHNGVNNNSAVPQCPIISLILQIEKDTFKF